MSGQKASASTRSRRFIKGCLLFAAFWCVFSGKVIGQEKADLTKPFKKCWSYGTSNGLLRIIASDNVSEIILTNDGFKLISIDPRTKHENWISEAGGRLEANPVSDGNNLFFLTSFNSENESKIYTLNSISLQTGIIVWQRRLEDYTSVRIESSWDKTQIYLVGGTKLLLVINKVDGSIVWKKDFVSSISSVESMSGGYLSVLTEDHLYRLSVQSGNLIEEWSFGGRSFNKAILKGNYAFLGYPTGEVTKFATNGRKKMLWKIKTGGSISELYELGDGVLAASLDNFLYLFSGQDGKIRWRRRVSGRINISPLIYEKYAIVLNSADNLVIVIDLSDGKVVNQISVEDDNYFLGEPFVVGNQMVLQTFKGLYFFVSGNSACS